MPHGDDGIGFAPEEARRPPSLGLGSMAERLAARGELAIDGAPGRGTRIDACVPLGQLGGMIICSPDPGDVIAAANSRADCHGVDPQAWLTDVLARIADMPLSRLPELLPWNWAPVAIASKAA